MTSHSKPLTLNDPSQPRPWFVRWRRAWTIAVPLALLTFSIRGRGSRQFDELGLALVIAGQLVRLWAAGCIDKDRRLTTDGPFAWLRHPLYFGSFVIAVGYALLSGLWPMLLVVPMVFALIYVPTMRFEETQLRRRFGPLAEDYCREVPAFRPRLPRERLSFGPFTWRRLARNREWETAIANAVAVTVFLLT